MSSERVKSFALAGAVGILGALGFPLVIPWISAEPLLGGPVRPAALLFAIGWLAKLARSDESLRQIALTGWVAGSFHFAVLVYWLIIAMVEFGNMPTAVGCLVLLLLALYCGLYWAAIPALAAYLRRRLGGYDVLCFITSVLLLEELKSLMISGFPWGNFGYGLATTSGFAQWASVGGVGLLSALLCILAGVGLNYLEARGTPQAGSRGITLMGVLLIITLGGEFMLRTAREGLTEGERSRVAIVQGNIEQRIKNRTREYRATIKQAYLQGTQEASLDPVDLIVWPESSWPTHIATTRKQEDLGSHAAPILFGAVGYDPGRDRQYYNAAFWAEPNGILTERYDKRHLVPFGEYVPLRGLLPVGKLVPNIIDLTPGTSHAPLGADRIGVLICYDGVFPELSRHSVNAGATILANLTNDGWYGVSSGPYQHLEFYQIRAIETRRWVIRAANTGVSAFIDPAGTITTSQPLNSAGVLRETVYKREGLTLFAQLGDWPLALAGIFLFGSLLGPFVQSRREVDTRSVSA